MSSDYATLNIKVEPKSKPSMCLPHEKMTHLKKGKNALILLMVFIMVMLVLESGEVEPFHKWFRTRWAMHRTYIGNNWLASEIKVVYTAIG